MTNPNPNPKTKPSSQNPTQENQDFGNGVMQEHIKFPNQGNIHNQLKQGTSNWVYIGPALSNGPGPIRPVSY
jgi:hypothetical protein